MLLHFFSGSGTRIYLYAVDIGKNNLAGGDTS